MDLNEQIQEGQHRANQIIKQITNDIDELKKLGIALATYKEMLEHELRNIKKPQ